MDKRYTSLKNKAKERRLILSISNEEYLSIVESNECHYCQSTLPNVGYGLDRKYSNIGYTLDNCVPCCTCCNEEKGTIDYDDYIALWEFRRKKSPSVMKFSHLFSGYNFVITRNYILIDNWLRVNIKKLDERPNIATNSSVSFYEDEILNKLPIVKSIINNKLNRTEKIFARKCSIGLPSATETKDFLNSNHLKGYHNSRGYGLYYNNELVFVVTIKIFDEEIELYRVATKKNCVVVGGLSKIIAKIEEDFDMNVYSMMSYVDRRYHTGDGYIKSGFKFVGCTEGYFYTDKQNRFNRLMGRAQDGMSESEYVASKGWIKVYDAGQAKFIKTNVSKSGYENLVEFCKNNELELLTTKEEYIGSGRHKYVYVKPSCGHVFKRGRSRLYKSHLCPVCKGTGNSRVSDRIAYIAREKGLTIYNNDDVTSKHSIVRGICNSGHEFNREYRYIRDYGCPVCNGLNSVAKATLGGSSNDRKISVYNNILEHCKKTSQKCLTTIEDFMSLSGPSSHITLSIKCNNNHIRNTTWYTLKYYGCSICSRESIKERMKHKPKTTYLSKTDYQNKQRLSTYMVIESYVKSIGGKMVTTSDDFIKLCEEQNIKNSAIKVVYELNGKHFGVRRGKIKNFP